MPRIITAESAVIIGVEAQGGERSANYVLASERET